MDYRFNALNLSGIEIEIIQLVAAGKNEQATKMIKEKGLLTYRDGKKLRNRERSELEKKLEDLNLSIPWKE